MSFPSDLPRNAVSVVVSEFTGSHDAHDHRLLALAAYELVGYGLYLGFGDLRYPMNYDPKTGRLASRILDFLEKLDLSDLPKYVEIALFIAELATAGVSWPLIVLKVVTKFGPKILPLIFQIRELIKGA